MKKANLLFSGVFLSILSFSILGCSDKDVFSKNSTDSNQTVQIENLSADTVKINTFATEQPNKYLVVIEWPKNLGAIKILADSAVVFQTSGKITRFEDHVDGGKIINYEIQQINPDNSVLTQITNKTLVPLDLVFSGKTILTDNLKFTGGRLFLLGGGILQTTAFNVNIDVDEIISEDASIETYAANQKQVFEKSGAGGGNVTLKARTATGKLTANMRGISGGDGRGSLCWLAFGNNCNASSGGAGGDGGYFTLTLNENKNFVFSRSLENGIGGIAGIACAYTLEAGHQPGAHMIWDFKNGCQGYGQGKNNGTAGANGKGQICFRLKKEDPYACI